MARKVRSRAVSNQSSAIFGHQIVVPAPVCTNERPKQSISPKKVSSSSSSPKRRVRINQPK